MATKFVRSRRVRELVCNLTFANTTSAEIFTLPKGARVLDWIVNVKVAVAGGTTTLDTGTSADSDYFIDGVDVSSIGKAAPTLLYPGYETTAITGVYANLGASNTAGSLDVSILFSLEIDTPI